PERPVDSELQCDPAFCGKWNIIAWNVDSAHPIALFEVANTATLFTAVGKPRIHQIASMPPCAQSNCLRNQRVGRSLVSMFDHGNNVHQTRLCICFVCHQLDESNQLAFKKSSDENGAVKMCGFLPANRSQILAVVVISSPLPDRTFVINLPNALCQRLTESDFAKDYTFLCCLFRFVASFEADLMPPPMVKCRYL